jgi:hypothetical protein
MAFEQRGYFVGKVVYAAVRDIKKKDAEVKSGTSYTAIIRTPEGVGVVITTNLWVKSLEKMKESGRDDRLATLREQAEKFNDMVANYKTEDFYIGTMIRPATINKDIVQFNTVSSKYDDEGRLKMEVRLMNSFPSIVEHRVGDDDEVYLMTSKGKEYKFSEAKTNFSVKMLVNEINEQEVNLTDNADNYPITMVAEFPANIENRCELGQGYEFKLTLEKGGIIESAEADGFSFDEEATPSFAPDRIVITGGSIIRDYTMEAELETEDTFGF